MFCISCHFMLRLHYVPGGHGSHDFGHRGRNGVTVTQRRGTGSTNVARRGCRDRRDRFFMLRLHYIPGGHGSHDFGHRGRNGVTVTQRRGTGSTNVARRGCRDRFLNSQKICHGSHGGIDLLKCAVVERGERNKT